MFKLHNIGRQTEVEENKVKYNKILYIMTD